MRWITTLILIGLSGCATNIDAPASEDSQNLFCQIYEPILVREKLPTETEGPENEFDTPETIRQADSNNAAYECSCNDDCPEVQ